MSPEARAFARVLFSYMAAVFIHLGDTLSLVFRLKYPCQRAGISGRTYLAPLVGGGSQHPTQSTVLPKDAIIVNLSEGYLYRGQKQRLALRLSFRLIHLILMAANMDVKADASCKDSQKAWESDNGERYDLSKYPLLFVYLLGLTSILLARILVDILRENPDQSLKDALLRMRSKAYKIVSVKQMLSKVRQDKGYDTSDFQNPELSSPRPLDMSRPWRMNLHRLFREIRETMVKQAKSRRVTIEDVNTLDRLPVDSKYDS
ncbi:hypothetical protein B0H14DRAFT_3130117 [Mycena olivaceomarginata]|nr:hypothetical protein B0H14DRAFT_3130117 [Mycena olivaceomarginata]